LRAPALAYWLIDRGRAWREARVSGDTELAAALSFVAANLRWEFEEDLSRVVGDVPAHRAGQTLRAAARWPAQVARAGALNAAEYLSEETRLLATPLDCEDFSLAVDELRDAAERLDKRLAHLEGRLAGRTHR
jgi:ubiquinone biosynthesis accessory factor UbiJ